MNMNKKINFRDFLHSSWLPRIIFFGYLVVGLTLTNHPWWIILAPVWMIPVVVVSIIILSIPVAILIEYLNAWKFIEGFEIEHDFNLNKIGQWFVKTLKLIFIG